MADSNKPKKSLGAKIAHFIFLLVLIFVAKIAGEAGMPPIVWFIIAAIGGLYGFIKYKGKK